jgi:hypothetical protein
MSFTLESRHGYSFGVAEGQDTGRRGKSAAAHGIQLLPLIVSIHSFLTAYKTIDNLGSYFTYLHQLHIYSDDL